ncbi:hypothetical protein [Promicromonospora sukumoe]|uniref:hypothetical protein n=1 Tax=Promicromonospora sukumoe TaxID=88382 RepID=UPI003649ADE6
MWRAYLLVGSSTASLSELTAALGPSSDGSHSIGDLPRRPRRLPAYVKVPPARPFDWSKWTHRLWWRASRHAGVDGITRAVEALPGDLADRLRSRAGLGDAVRLVVVQDMDGRDPHGARGFFLSTEALDWLARAGATLDIDQYADLVGESDEVVAGYRPPLDLDWWRDSMVASLRRLEARSREHEQEGTPSAGRVRAASTERKAVLPSTTPNSLVELYDAIDELSLLFVDEGYVIHPAAWLNEASERGHPERVVANGAHADVVTFGSDGVGGYFALAVDGGHVLYVPPTEDRDTVPTVGAGGVREIAADLDAFLRQLLDIVDAHVEGLPA